MAEYSLPIEELPDALARVRAFLNDHCDEFGVTVIDGAVERIGELEARVRYQANEWRKDYNEMSERKDARIAELESVLREIADNTPDGSHALDEQLAPGMVRLNHIARAALGALPVQAEGNQ